MSRLFGRIVFVALFGVTLGCERTDDPSGVPNARETLRAVGKRLGAKLSPSALQTLGEDQTRLVAVLTASERRSLSLGELVFRVDRPVVVEIGVMGDRPPFWLSPLGFTRTGRHATSAVGRFELWSRRYSAGMIGLGVDSLDRRGDGPYVVFVRSESGASPRIDLLDSPDWETKRHSATGPYVDDARGFESLPDSLKSAQLLRTRRDRRDAYALVRGKVWKTRLPSSPSADQVTVAFGEDPARSLSFSWRTDVSIPFSEVRLDRGHGTPTTLALGEVVPIGSAGLLNDPTISRHRVRVAGLEPDTTYRYAVRDGSTAGWSAWRTIKTAPVGDRPYSFLYMGDPQCGLEDWGKLLVKAKRSHPNAGFLLIAGDLVDRGNERSNWDHFFQRATGVFDALPMMPAVGNHEYLDQGPAIYGSTFVLPRNGPSEPIHRLAYRFEYSDSFVAVLDSNPAVYSRDSARRQAEWLDEALSKTNARWKFVVFHHPVYASHPSREQPSLAEAWVPIFDKHHVDMVLQGHDHAYLRTYPMRAGIPQAATDPGTAYVVSVSGTKFVPQAPRAYTAVGFTDVATYQTIEIDPRRGTLVYRALDLGGRERDRLELRKPVRTPLAVQPKLDPAIRRSSVPE